MGYWGTGYMGPGNRICMWAWDMLTQDMLGLLAQDMWAQDIIIYAWDMLARDMLGWDTYVGMEYVGTRYAQDMLAWDMLAQNRWAQDMSRVCHGFVVTFTCAVVSILKVCVPNLLEA